MKIMVIGAGLMGRAIIHDLIVHSNFEKITLIDRDEDSLKTVLKKESNQIHTERVDVEDKEKIKELFEENDIVISAIPYFFNYELSKMAIDSNTNFIDLGGNNDIVDKQKKLSKQAKEKNILIIPDCGLAPGLVSIITKDIVDTLTEVESVKLRVGGLPLKPKMPFNYQFVFSPNGLINEYVEEAIVLDNGEIKTKKSMTDIEKISFPEPFSEMEAFITSGGCSTLPYTYKNEIKNLDYKTIRYPGHCEKFKLLLDLGLGSNEPMKNLKDEIVPRKVLIKLLEKFIPYEGEDVVLLKAIGMGEYKNKRSTVEYTMIDYYDKKNDISAMMRTTGYPVSITAQMIQSKEITASGVFTSEEIIPPEAFFKELSKRDIEIKKEIK